MPEPWQQRLAGSFSQLLLIHLLREECFVPAAHQYVSQHLGKEFTEPEPWTLDEVFEETSAKTPIIFILTTGKSAAVASLAHRLCSLSLLCRHPGAARHHIKLHSACSLACHLSALTVLPFDVLTQALTPPVCSNASASARAGR